MDLPRLRRALYAELATKLPEWDLFEAEGTFERVLGTVSWRLRLSTLTGPGGLDVIADVGVEHHQNGDCLCVVGAELGAIAHEGTRKWTIGALVDVPPTAGSVLSQFTRVAHPFLTRYSAVPEILRVLRTNPAEARIIRPFVDDLAAEAAAIEARWGGQA